MKKFASRKFLVFLLTFLSSLALCVMGRIDGQWFAIITIANTLIYLFVEGVLDVRQLNLNMPMLNIKGESPAIPATPSAPVQKSISSANAPEVGSGTTSPANSR